MDEQLERLRVIVVAGISTGAVVAGLGGRLAMLLLRLTSDDRVDGVKSDDGFTIGEVTLAGTYNLLMLGAAIGLIGAVAYLAVAPWLIGPGWFRRATVAAGSGAVVGSMLVHADGVDFTLLEPTWFAIGLFVALPALFGLAIGVAVDRVAAPGSWTVRGRRRWILPVVAVGCFPLTALVGLFVVPIGMVVVAASVALHGASASQAAVRTLVRGAWLAIAVAGLAALLGDIGALTR
jgi:hypothetical protein